MTDVLTMCWEFFKIGLFAVGGGLATLPFFAQMQQEYHWFTTEMLGNMVAVSESTPGPIGVAMSGYVGYNMYGIFGGVIATFSLILPSLVIIMLIDRAMKQYQENLIVKNVFAWVRPAVAGLLASAGFSMIKSTLIHSTNFTANFFACINWVSAIGYVVLLAFLMIKKFGKIHPIVYIAAGAVLGVVAKL